MDKHCRICHNTSCSNHGKDISFLGDGWKCNYIPVPTNADRIRAMSDEELAKIINAFTAYFDECNRNLADTDCHNCELCKLCGLGKEKAIDWLQQPFEGE